MILSSGAVCVATSDENHRCAASNDDTVNYWSFTVTLVCNDFPFIRDLTITRTLFIYLKVQSKKQIKNAPLLQASSMKASTPRHTK